MGRVAMTERQKIAYHEASLHRIQYPLRLRVDLADALMAHQQLLGRERQHFADALDFREEVEAELYIMYLTTTGGGS